MDMTRFSSCWKINSNNINHLDTDVPEDEDEEIGDDDVLMYAWRHFSSYLLSLLDLSTELFFIAQGFFLGIAPNDRSDDIELTSDDGDEQTVAWISEGDLLCWMNGFLPDELELLEDRGS